MPRKREIDPKGNSVIITVRFSGDILGMLNIITKNRSQFVRDATWEKIGREMEVKDESNVS